MNATAIREALRCGRSNCQCARGRNVHCPGSSHSNNDHDPSLTVDDRNGTVLWHCKRGCSQSEIASLLKERGLLGDSVAPTITAHGERLVREYEFKDVAGQLLALHGRFESNTGKTFRWRVPGGQWRDGLGFPESNLPLYNLAGVVEQPGARVWVVEGEKAADACTDKGLLAVSLPGGASQQRFGNALDPLKGRDVVLWPDNDDAGRALMQLVAGYLPEARVVLPTVQPKGDAYDYFHSGGTVEALEDGLRSLQPTTRIIDADHIEHEYPVSGGVVRFAFSQFFAKGRDTDAFVVVKVDYPGFRGIDYSTHLNLSSVSNRSAIRLELEKVFDEKSLAWPKVMASACSAVERAWKTIDASMDLYEVSPLVERKWFVHNWAPADATTIPFGPGGAGKSFLALDVMLHALNGEPWLGRETAPIDAFGLVDYEDREGEWRLRVEQVSRPHGWDLQPGQFFYVPGRGIPLVDQSQQLVALALKHKWRGLIVDSAVSACGGLVKDEAAVARLLNFLSDLGRIGITTILLAHNTKDDDTRYPLGSIYWHNLVRATHYIEHHQVDGAQELDWLLWNRKSNRGKQRPISARLVFPVTDDGGITIEQIGTSANAVAQDDAGATARVLRAMQDINRLTSVAEIAVAAVLTEAMVRTTLNRLEKRGAYVVRGPTEGHAQLWGLRTELSETLRVTTETLRVTPSETTETVFRSDSEAGSGVPAREVAPEGRAPSVPHRVNTYSEEEGISATPLVIPELPPFEDEEGRIDSLAGGM